MNSNDLEVFTTAFTICWKTLPHKHRDEDLDFFLKVYYDALVKFNINDVETAFKKALIRVKWFPQPVELIELIDGTSEIKGDVQSSIVWDTIKSKGAYSSVCFDDPVTNAVISRFFGGWVKLCSELKENEQKWFLKDFSKYYQSASASGMKETKSLPGIFQIENQGNEQFKQIGDVLKKLEFKEKGD